MNEQLPSIGYMRGAEPPRMNFAAKQLLRVWRRHIRLFFACAFSILIVGSGAIQFLKPSYTATAVVTISPQIADPLPMGDQQPVNQNEDEDLPETVAFEMRSRDVAAAVLAQNPPLEEKPGSSLSLKFCHAGLSFLCPTIAPADPAVQRQTNIDGFLSALTIVPEAGSQVIDVSVGAETGERAAMLANSVVSNYQRISLAQQTGDVNRVADWLDARTEALQQRWLDAVDTADTFSVSHNLTNAGDGTTLVDKQIVDTAASLEAAQSQLAVAQARADALHHAVRHGDTGAVVELPDQPILVAAANALMELQSTREQLAEEFGPNYPKLKAIDQQIAATQATLDGQTGAALASIGESLISARAEVDQLTEHLNQLRAQAEGQSAQEAEYRSLSAEAESARTAYETFLEHSNEVVNRAALLEPPVVFVSHADAPARPTFPNKPKLALAVLVLALTGGLSATFIRHHFSVGFEEADDLRATVPLPILATLPFIVTRTTRSITRYVLENPFSRTSEAVRGLAAKLSLLAANGNAPRSVLVASAGAREGKSTLAVWLAMTVRQGGQAVLVIDCDHRRVATMRDASTESKLGLTDLISGCATLADVIETDVPTKVDFIFPGRPMSCPFGAAEIVQLRSVITAMKRSYSLIIFDSPPLLAMTDALVYGSVVDQTVFVCCWQRTSRNAVTASLDRLRVYGANVVGLVVSMVEEYAMQDFDGVYSRPETKLIRSFYNS